MFSTTSVFNWSFTQIPTLKPKPLLGLFWILNIRIITLGDISDRLHLVKEVLSHLYGPCVSRKGERLIKYCFYSAILKPVYMANLLLQKLLVFNIPIMLCRALHRFVFDILHIRHLVFDRILTILQNK